MDVAHWSEKIVHIIRENIGRASIAPTVIRMSRPKIFKSIFFSFTVQGALIRTGQKTFFLQKWTGQKILDGFDWSIQTKTKQKSLIFCLFGQNVYTKYTLYLGKSILIKKLFLTKNSFQFCVKIFDKNLIFFDHSSAWTPVACDIVVHLYTLYRRHTAYSFDLVFCPNLH